MKSITKQEILAGLRAIGVTPGAVLEVHSSLSSFGHVEGGAETLIAALKEAVGEEGSIFMPALRLSPNLPLTAEDRARGVRTKIRVLDAGENRSRCGIVADTFRLLPDTRVQDGVFAVAAWGRHADEVADGLRYPIEHGGKALLLGVDIYTLTAMHYMEGHLPREIAARFKSPGLDEYYLPDRWLVEDWEPPVKAWYTIQDKAYERGLITDGMIGPCRCMYFDIAAVTAIYRDELIRDPFGLFGLKD